MNAPFVDFVRRFRQLERELATSPPPEAIVLLPASLPRPSDRPKKD